MEEEGKISRRSRLWRKGWRRRKKRKVKEKKKK